jgi:peptidoglycan-associated lipoprotein
MYKLRSSKFVIGVMSAVLALMLAFPLSAVAQDDDDGPNGETAAELLVDGMDAAADHAVDSARRLFQKLISVFPGSPEASRARRELSALDRNGGVDEERAAIRADEAERTAEYRHAFLINAGDRVFFAESSATLGGRARSIIENQARWLKARPNLPVTVIGRADDGGDRRAANLLSTQRAEAVRDRLVAAGLDPSRIGLRPTGNDDKVALCSTSLCRAQNRNAEVFINDLRDQDPIRSSMQSPAARTPRSSLGRAVETGQVAQ